MADGETGASRPVFPDERTGVLHPERLSRYAAGRTARGARVREVVDHYWHVAWHLDEGEELEQRIIDFPAVNLTIETGDVPGELVVTGLHSVAWRRTISGRGSVFGIRLRPAGLAVVSDLLPQDIADATIEVTAEGDGRLYSLLGEIRDAGENASARATAADAALAALLDVHPVSETGRFANGIVDELSDGIRGRTGDDLAARLGRSSRTVQRALAATLGHGPKWVGRRIRLQEVALALARRSRVDLADLAAELGYTDQSHLTADFRRAAGMTPQRYRQSLPWSFGDESSSAAGP